MKMDKTICGLKTVTIPMEEVTLKITIITKTSTVRVQVLIHTRGITKEATVAHTATDSSTMIKVMVAGILITIITKLTDKEVTKVETVIQCAAKTS